MATIAVKMVEFQMYLQHFSNQIAMKSLKVLRQRECTAIPVVLTESDEWEAWMDGMVAVEMQRSLPDGALKLVDDAV